MSAARWMENGDHPDEPELVIREEAVKGGGDAEDNRDASIDRLVGETEEPRRRSQESRGGVIEDSVSGTAESRHGKA